MLVQRIDPRGIDFGIQQIQSELFSELIKRGWVDYHSFDRAYRNTKGADKIPEVYTKDGNYKEALYDDRKAVTSFFLSDEKRTYDYQQFMWTQNVSIIFQANLSKLFPTIKHRADEEMINQITLAMKAQKWDNRLIEIITGFEKVYDSLKLSYNNKEFNDMGNACIARFNFKMIFSNTDKIIFVK